VTDPTDPTDPSGPSGPTDPTGPTNPRQTADPRRPIDRVRTVAAVVAARPVVARARALVRQRPRQVALGAAVGLVAVVALVGFVACSGPDDARTPGRAASTSVFSAPPPEPSGPLLPSPTPAKATDGCRGLVTAAQVSTAAGFAVSGAGGDAAAAVTGYADAVRAQGLDATIRLCPFGNPGGDQVYVLAMTFADAGQATRMYTTGQVGRAGSQPVAGVGDAAATDRVSTLLARRGRSVVLVLLIRPGQPTADHVGALRAVALAALGKA
jgi:hypothetical protein